MKIIFWNVDTQNDFMNKDGALYVPGAEEIKPVLGKLTRLAIKKGIKIINTGDSHMIFDNEISTNPDMITTFPMHCEEGTNGKKFITETITDDTITVINDEDLDRALLTMLSDNNIVILKNKFDVFEGNINTIDVLELVNPNIVVYGVATNVCVNCAVLGILKNSKARVIVVKDAIKELPDEAMPEELKVSNIYKNWTDKGVIIADYDFVKKVLN